MTSTGWTWAVACRRGVSHEKANVRLQDAFKCFIASTQSRPLVVVVSDGAGSAPFGGEGASLVCRKLTVCTRQYFSLTDELPTDDMLAGWLSDIRNLIEVVAARRNVAARDFAATLILVISSGLESVVLHVGDSITYANPYGAWARSGAGKTPDDVAVLRWMHTGADNDSDGWAQAVDRFVLAGGG